MAGARADAARTRLDGRSADTLRDIGIETRVQRFPEGSVIYRSGNTRVLIAASVEEGTQEFLKGTGKGWISAEYAMHPRANPTRNRREGQRGPVSGRTQEIQRLIGRALRAAIHPEKLGERTIMIDCDVLDADGGTRTASITGGFIALVMALDSLRKRGLCGKGVLREPVAAVSIGLFQGSALLDLCYEEDRDTQVDLNLVATASGAIVEVQGTAEGAPMTRAEHDSLLATGLAGVTQLIEAQKGAIDRLGIDLTRLFA